jgi:hypothetical protein
MRQKKIENKNISLGSASISPSAPVEAGSLGCWRLTYVIGKRGIKEGGGIIVSTDSDTDWGESQFQKPKRENFTTISTTGKSNLSCVLTGGYLRQKLKIHVHGCSLVEGDEVCVVFGNGVGGCPGSRVQTFAEERRYFRVSVDVLGDGRFIELSDHPFLRVVGGSVDSLSVIVPSQVVLGEVCRVVVRALDRFGNPSCSYSAVVRFVEGREFLSLPEEVVFGSTDMGGLWLDGVVVKKVGLCRVVMEDDEGRVGYSNPILCLRLVDDNVCSRFRLFWGDLHGQVKLAEKIDEYFRFARDVSGVDFASHQRNDHEVSSEDWMVTKRVVKEVNKPGRFVAFLGFEWSGQHEVGGDHNVYFLDDDEPIRRSGHEMVEDKSDVDTDLTHIKDVYALYREKRVFIIPHVGGRPANIDFHDPSLEPVVEIHSTHGTFEWFLRDVLRKGYRVGFVAGSDDYKLRLGGAYPGVGDRRFVRGGLVAVYAKDLSREGVYEALKSRRCYGTTGERIILKVYADNHFMGSEYVTKGFPEIRVKVFGTCGLESVELYRGLEKIYDYPLVNEGEASSVVKVVWMGSSREWPYSGVLWEGELRVDSGSLSDFNPMPLDRGDECFFDVSDSGFKWRSYTCGGRDGASFKVDNEEAKINITCRSIPTVSALGKVCSPMSQFENSIFSYYVKDISLEPMIVDVGSVGRHVTVQRFPEDVLSKEVDFRFVDEEVRVGVNPYWVRVVQSDGGTAWSSPIYVNRLSDS